MNHASLFSGIGGAEVAASMIGWQNLFHCEIQEFPRKVLDYWFPNSESYEDNGALRPNGLTDFLDFNGMMPTPSARDWKGCTNPGVKKVNGNVYGETLPDTVKKVTGSTSQLNPLFVEEMMGFPLMWTALPFLSQSGDKNP